ncbi:biotin/lipoyl-containing protein [Pedobacter sp. MW01-1-1]|uniref:biotin/lipoyl-containing protein n=1 Tax=Pedobacter sp. MW01-1-1 TaxID=3383027 RepID=UPI003FF03E41
MYKVKVNEDRVFDIEQNNMGLLVNGKSTDIDLQHISPGISHVLYQNKSFNIEVVELDKKAKTCRIKINENTYSLTAEDTFDQLLKQMGMDTLGGAKASNVHAPMPGLVLKVLVHEGAEVKKGDNLLILEAMKMENILKSAADGQVKRILIAQGDKVEKNQILIELV